LLGGPLGGGVGGDAEVEDPAALVSQYKEDIQDLKTDGRHRKEVDRYQGLDVISRKVRQVCEGGFGRRTMYLPTLVSPTWIPSLSSSP
jgi:hypothetical protein